MQTTCIECDAEFDINDNADISRSVGSMLLVVCPFCKAEEEMDMDLMGEFDNDGE